MLIKKGHKSTMHYLVPQESDVCRSTKRESWWILMEHLPVLNEMLLKQNMTNLILS